MNTIVRECHRLNRETTKVLCDKMRERDSGGCGDCLGVKDLVSMELKVCPKCNLNLPKKQFYKDETTKDGYAAKCKECHKKAHKKSNLKNKAKNKDKPLDTIKIRTCYSCKRELPLTAFSKDPNRTEGVGYQCKDCKNEQWKTKNLVGIKEKEKIKSSAKKENVTLIDKINELVKKLDIEEEGLLAKEKKLKANRTKIDREILDVVGEIDGINQAQGTIIMIEELIKESEDNPKKDLGALAMLIFQTYRE